MSEDEVIEPEDQAVQSDDEGALALFQNPVILPCHIDKQIVNTASKLPQVNNNEIHKNSNNIKEFIANINQQWIQGLGNLRILEQIVRKSLRRAKRNCVSKQNKKYQLIGQCRYFHKMKKIQFETKLLKLMALEKRTKSKETDKKYRPHSSWLIQWTFHLLNADEQSGRVFINSNSKEILQQLYINLLTLFRKALASKSLWYTTSVFEQLRSLQAPCTFSNSLVKQTAPRQQIIQQNMQHEQQINLKTKQNYQVIQFRKKVNDFTKRQSVLTSKIYGPQVKIETEIKIETQIVPQLAQKIPKANQNQILKLKVSKPKCPINTCRHDLKDSKCFEGNHIIVLCSECGWSEHQCYDNKDAQHKQKFTLEFSITTQQQKMKYFKLPSIQPKPFLNNIRQTVQSFGYEFISHQRIVPGTPKQFICNYPLMAENASKTIIENRQKECYLPLQIRQSVIEGAGLGVFATEPIPEIGTLVCSYLGEIGTGDVTPVEKTYAGIKCQNNSIFTLGWLDKQILLIAPNHYSNVGRFINYNSPQLCNLRPSLCMIENESKLLQVCLFLTTTRSIEAGEELFYNYGTEYNQE